MVNPWIDQQSNELIYNRLSSNINDRHELAFKFRSLDGTASGGKVLFSPPAEIYCEDLPRKETEWMIQLIWRLQMRRFRGRFEANEERFQAPWRVLRLRKNLEAFETNRFHLVYQRVYHVIGSGKRNICLIQSYLHLLQLKKIGSIRVQ